jgi:YD repeat-containing protein
MTDTLPGECRYFLTYSGISLPLKLVEPLEGIDHRNTYYRGYFDDQNRLTGCQKVVYNEVETQHRYSYHANNQLQSAEITDADGDVTVLEFDDAGQSR